MIYYQLIILLCFAMSQGSIHEWKKRSSNSQFESRFDNHNLNHKTDEIITSFILHVCMVKLNIKK
jgi:hypothetical protein